MIQIKEDGWIQLPQEVLYQLKWQANDSLLLQQTEHKLLLHKKEDTLLPTLFVRCFGQFSIEYNGNKLRIKNKKLKEMLAFLASCNNEFIHKWTIAQQLWPDSPKPKAMDCLYKVLNDLYRSDTLFHQIPIEIHREQVRLHLDSSELDIALFEELSTAANSPSSWLSAIKLYRGGFLEHEFYEWSVLQQMKYEILFELLEKKIKNL